MHCHSLYPDTQVENLYPLKKRFQIKRCIFVGDRDLVSKENLNYLTQEEYPFIVALRKRNSDEVKNILKAAVGNYSILSDILRCKEVVFKDMRYLLCVTTPSKEHRLILKSVGINNIPRILQT